MSCACGLSERPCKECLEHVVESVYLKMGGHKSREKIRKDLNSWWDRIDRARKHFRNVKLRPRKKKHYKKTYNSLGSFVSDNQKKKRRRRRRRRSA